MTGAEGGVGMDDARSGLRCENHLYNQYYHTSYLGYIISIVIISIVLEIFGLHCKYRHIMLLM